jgi:hypothetical protein
MVMDQGIRQLPTRCVIMGTPTNFSGLAPRRRSLGFVGGGPIRDRSISGALQRGED